MYYMRFAAYSIVLLLTCFGQPALGAAPKDGLIKTTLTSPESNDYNTWIDANKILMFVTNNGGFGRDLTSTFGKNAGTFYPYQDTSLIRSGDLDTYVLFAAGLWMGGKVDGEIRVSVSEYSSEYAPGPMENETFIPDQPEFKVYKLYRDSLESNPNDDYLNWPVEQGAPVNESGQPDMRGDQMLWSVFNDADPARHTNDAGETAPLGIEVRQTVWAEDEDGEIIIPNPMNILITQTGNSSGKVSLEVLDFELLNGHEYIVIFEDDLAGRTTWDLIDITAGQTILDNIEDQIGTPFEVDGAFQIRVVAPTLGMRGSDMYITDDTTVWGWDIPNGTRRFTWAGGADGFGWTGFRGALGWGGPGDHNGFGTHDPVPATDLPKVLLKLAPVDSAGNFDPNHEDVSYAYRYLRSPGEPARPEFEPYIIDQTPPGGNYGYQDFEKSCPLSAWNMNVDPPQRLTVGYLENNQINGLVDGQYWPGYYVDYDNTVSTGPREWLWIYLDDYSETPNPDYQLNAINDPMPIMYWATWARLAEEGWLDEDEFLIIPEDKDYIPVTDSFSFTPEFDQIMTSGGEGLAIYIKYDLTNKGGNQIEDLYLSLWSDPDLGGAGDDFVGCDPEDNIFYCYNAQSTDSKYHNFPPAMGFKIVQGPIVESPGDSAWVDNLLLPDHRNLGLTSFARFIGAQDPNAAFETYSNMRGFWGGGEPFQDHLGNVTTFQFAGDPVTGEGDLDRDPADRRMLGTVGPINMAPSETQQLIIKMAVGQGTDRLSSLTSLRDILNSEPSPGDTIHCCGLYTDGQTGNTNFDGEGNRNIADIVKLIDRVYLSKRLLYCEPSGNVNGDPEGKLNLADIVKLIDHIYLSKQETATCE